MRERNENYLTRLRDGVRLSRKKSKLDEKNPPFIEYIFEAYFFLRKRDGEGSPLPTKQEVKNTAALIAAFHQGGLTAKLPGFLWGISKLTELTEAEHRRVEGVKRSLLDGHDHNWTQRLAAAGLGDLKRAKTGPKNI